MSFSSNLDTLRRLVQSLPDRDLQQKRDAKLFEEFFENFPIPVTMWSLDEEGKLLSKRGNTVIKDDCSSCEDMFIEAYSDDFKERHEEAFKGEVVSFFSFLKENTYFTKIIPWKNGDKVTGLTGISWDISSNYEILGSLKKIVSICGESSEAGKIALDAISKSRIPITFPEEETDE